jgi:hypothetical protein
MHLSRQQRFLSLPDVFGRDPDIGGRLRWLWGVPARSVGSVSWQLRLQCGWDRLSERLQRQCELRACRSVLFRRKLRQHRSGGKRLHE